MWRQFPVLERKQDVVRRTKNSSQVVVEELFEDIRKGRRMNQGASPSSRKTCNLLGKGKGGHGSATPLSDDFPPRDVLPSPDAELQFCSPTPVFCPPSRALSDITIFRGPLKARQRCEAHTSRSEKFDGASKAKEFADSSRFTAGQAQNGEFVFGLKWSS